ncbi:hypothetical protein TNCV_2852881 [Trichonephila clavipes]|uniref:Uncharacterized protein n=1 Tax=Trichonephila clavipes TaxID=2585209 RepID=A0A8X6R5V5_TRICX|nr:hypothetical protein TNCV_2852881 [Trichonephila clavipes]
MRIIIFIYIYNGLSAFWQLFGPFLRRTVACASPKSNRPHLSPRPLNGRLCHQDTAATVKTDSNPKTPCLDCKVDVALISIPACIASSRPLHKHVVAGYLDEREHLPP